MEPPSDTSDGSKGGVMRCVLADDSKCTGCRMCELACAFRRTKRILPDAAAIRIEQDWDEGLSRIRVCRQCDEPACVDACPTGALYRDENGVVLLKNEDCAVCGSCVEACPYVAIHMPREGQPPVKCDLCGGRPLCVELCAPSALSVENQQASL